MPVEQRKKDDLMARDHHSQTVVVTMVYGVLVTASLFFCVDYIAKKA